jgi:hypothetical protein
MIGRLCEQSHFLNFKTSKRSLSHVLYISDPCAIRLMIRRETWGDYNKTNATHCYHAKYFAHVTKRTLPTAPKLAGALVDFRLILILINQAAFFAFAPLQGGPAGG